MTEREEKLEKWLDRIVFGIALLLLVGSVLLAVL